MNEFNKPIILNAGGVGDDYFTIDICYFTITEEIKSKILQFGNSREQLDADSISFLTDECIWSIKEGFEYSSDTSELEMAVSLLKLNQIHVENTTVVVFDQGFYLETFDESSFSLFTTQVVPFDAITNNDLHVFSDVYEPLYLLRELAQRLDNDWSEREGVVWQDAEDLVTSIKALSPALLAVMPMLTDILSYSSSENEWDSGSVALWPDSIIDAITSFFRTIPTSN